MSVEWIRGDMLNARYKNSTGHAMVVSKKNKINKNSPVSFSVMFLQQKERSISTIDMIALQSVLFDGTK